MTLTPRLFLAAFLLGGCASSAAGTLNGDPYLARKRLATELASRQEWDAAFAYTDEMHKERPDDPEVLVLRGIILRERKLYTEAEADLKAALALRSDFPEAHAALGILYDMQGRGVEAEPEHRHAMRLRPEGAPFLNNLGFCLYLQGRGREAVGLLTQAARIAPTDQRIRTNLGFALAAAGDWPRAAREFKLGGTESQASNNLGFAYERRGDLIRAYDLYVEAVRLDPKADRPRRNLAHVAQSLGRHVPADLPPAPTPSPSEEPKP